jgi:hypothetical protein
MAGQTTVWVDKGAARSRPKGLVVSAGHYLRAGGAESEEISRRATATGRGLSKKTFQSDSTEEQTS